MSNLVGSAVRLKHSREPKPLSAKRAMERMRTGSRLVHMHDGKARGRHWFVVPGGTVTDEVANVIKNHPSVIGGKDGLFPDHDQTWRMKTFAQLAS
jgi:hypothetical protein